MRQEGQAAKGEVTGPQKNLPKIDGEWFNFKYHRNVRPLKGLNADCGPSH